MTHDRLMRVSMRWFRLLLRLYPADFRDEMGRDVVDVYCDRARLTLKRRGAMGLAWLRPDRLLKQRHEARIALAATENAAPATSAPPAPAAHPPA